MNAAPPGGAGRGGDVDGWGGVDDRVGGQAGQASSHFQTGGRILKSSKGEARAAFVEAQRRALEGVETVVCPSCGDLLVYARFGDRGRWVHMGRGDVIQGAGRATTCVVEQPSPQSDPPKPTGPACGDR